jgi:hypothetical protein
MNQRTIKVLSFLLVFTLMAGNYVSALAAPAEKALAQRWVASKPVHTVIQAGQSHEIIEVKFVEGSAYRLQDGKFVTQGNDNLASIQTVLQAHAVRTVERLFTESENDILAEKVRIEAASGEQMPDLNLWYRFTVAPGADAAALVDALNALPEVEIAYPAPLPAPLADSPGGFSKPSGFAPLQAFTPTFVFRQGYLNPAPGGIDAKYAWTRSGGTGKNVVIADIEYSFNKTHEDLKAISIVGGVMYNGYGNDHGTAVQGELISKPNAYGMTGIANAAGSRFSSPCSNSACSSYNPANAINIARLHTTPGDVILIEQQTSVCGLSDYGPMEWYQSTYDAIKTSTAAGRIVVEAAGNGSVNLDAAGCHNLFKRSVRDSGAIIVGAGAPPAYSQTDRSRLYYSTYGSRVDLQGWGFNVATTGYGDLQAGGPNRFYTAIFSGTSSASPIVAGAAALLSSIAQQRGHLMTSAWIRATLVATGSPQLSAAGYPASQKIGPRPNLKAAIARVP